MKNSKMASAVFFVIAPLNSIIEDLFADLNSKGYRAATLLSLKPDNFKDLHVNILGSAEEALRLSSEFTAELKKSLFKATSAALLCCYRRMPYTHYIAHVLGILLMISY